MSDLVKLRVKMQNTHSIEQESMVLREIIQEIALLGLWRAKFFEHAAFYGGTALRVLYGLDRFSEDLDFTLLKKNKDFDIEPYANAIALELEAFDFDANVERKAKSIETCIESAFIKADSHVSFVSASSKFKPQKGSLIKVKLEIDTDAVQGFETEAKHFFWPQPFSVLTCDLPSLMAGKLHAAFCRGLRKNVKGRDWYDLLWYLGQGIKPNWLYLEAKMRDSGHWNSNFSPKLFQKWAIDYISGLDIESAKLDIRRFIKDPRRIDGWSKELFASGINRLL
jgi:predicted nucleotidyltransferase component of viral defense system